MAIMLTGIFSSSNALQAFQSSLDTTANNLANVETNAFKSRRTLFQDLFYSGSQNGQVGQGSQVGTTDRNFSQGKMIITGNELDVAIQGQGFLALATSTGTTQYSRDGALRLDATGVLVNGDGLVVQPPITFPADVTSTKISSDGTVSVLTASSPNTPIVLGQLRLTNFTNPQGLQAISGNRFVETKASGVPLTNIPGTNGLGVLIQGSLEQSNVDTTTEIVRLTATSRNYVANSRALKVEDTIIDGALSLVG
jgi:flagellar basal-body rod protein FlgG